VLVRDEDVDVIHRPKAAVTEIGGYERSPLQDEKRNATLIKGCEDGADKRQGAQVSDPIIASDSSEPLDMRIVYVQARKVLLEERKQALLSVGDRRDVEGPPPGPIGPPRRIAVKECGLQEIDVVLRNPCTERASIGASIPTR
jgi:hypothetical protein